MSSIDNNNNSFDNKVDVVSQKTSTDNLYEAFPHIRALDTKFYTEFPYSTNSLRRCKIMVLLGALSNYEGFRKLDEDVQDTIVRKVESGCVNATIVKSKRENIAATWETRKFTQMYNNLVLEKAYELDYDHNQHLAPLVTSGIVAAMRVGFLTPEEADPGRYEHLVTKSEVRKQTEVKTKISRLFTCEKCGKNETKFRSVQTKSADEAKSCFLLCIWCGWEWISNS